MVKPSVGLRNRCRRVLRGRLASLGIVDAASVSAADDALQRELDLIEHYDIAPLFEYFCDYAEALARNDIPAQAIGIAGGSMVLFASGLSHVFPPDEGLLFEHFFDGSKFYSVGRKIFVSLDMPGRVSRRLIAAWERKAQSVRANGLGVRIECTPRHYLSLYRRLRRQRRLLPPTCVRSYWPQVDPGKIIPTAIRHFAQDYVESSWAQQLPPLTWNHLILLCGRCERRPKDMQLLRKAAAGSQSLQNRDAETREAQTRLLVQDTLCYREDVMAHAHREIGISPGLASRLMLAVYKQQQERIEQFKDEFLASPDVKSHPRAKIEAEFNQIVSHALQATSKAHACSRALWAAYLAYAAPKDT
jgi:hypothetical protein